jgi:cytoskeletal protein CcmA (bactofilin family)
MALLSRERDEARSDGRAAGVGSGDLSIVSREMRVDGHLETRGRVRIEGAISGSVRARGVELAASGSVEGDVEAVAGEGDPQAFVIDGTVKGAVRAPYVEIGEAGGVMGGVETDDATVRGRIEGGIQARNRLALKATAVVEGDIDARRLALEEGGQVNGNIRIGDRAALAVTSTKPASDDARALA